VIFLNLFYIYLLICAPSKDGKEEDAAISGMDEEEDLAGFRLGLLKKRKPNLAQQLDDFGTFLMTKDVKVEELNVWDFKGKPI
jgi:hypothetical protein